MCLCPFDVGKTVIRKKLCNREKMNKDRRRKIYLASNVFVSCHKISPKSKLTTKTRPHHDNYDILNDNDCDVEGKDGNILFGSLTDYYKK